MIVTKDMVFDQEKFPFEMTSVPSTPSLGTKNLWLQPTTYADDAGPQEVPFGIGR